MKKAIQVDEKDNVATATSNIEVGDDVEVINPNGKRLLKTKSIERIIFGHKIALKDLDLGDDIIKYGQVIGKASKYINVGEWVHIQNVNSARMNTKGSELRGVT